MFPSTLTIFRPELWNRLLEKWDQRTLTLALLSSYKTAIHMQKRLSVTMQNYPCTLQAILTIRNYGTWYIGIQFISKGHIQLHAGVIHVAWRNGIAPGWFTELSSLPLAKQRACELARAIQIHSKQQCRITEMLQLLFQKVLCHLSNQLCRGDLYSL